MMMTLNILPITKEFRQNKQAWKKKRRKTMLNNGDT